MTIQQHKIPITLGVTGHQDLREAEKERLSQSVRQIFQFLKKHYPHTPLQLFSALAEGADRLVAQVALEEQVELIVPLPIPLDLYLQDFQTPESKSEFMALFNHAKENKQVFKLNLLEGISEEKLQTDSEARRQQAALAGAYIARHSHILIALWDGRHLNETGETAQVVHFKRTGDMKNLPKRYKPQHGPLDEPDTGPVCHLITSRESHEQAFACAGEIEVLLPHQNNKNHFNDLEPLLSNNLSLLNRFNQDVVRYGNASKLQNRIRKGQKYLLADTPLWQDLVSLSPAFQTMLGVYSTANTLARHFQSRIRLLTWLVLGIGFAMLSCYGWYTSIATHLPALIGYFILFSIGWGILWLHQWRAYHSKNLDYRALAEGLRVQIFWHLGGVTDSVADHYLRKQRGELIWIRQAIRAINIYDWVENKENLQVVYLHWIRNQLLWFSESAVKYELIAKKLSGWIEKLFRVGFILIIGLFVVHFTNALSPDSLSYDIFILLIAFFPATAALLHHYLEKMAFEEQAKQYERMAALFAKADEEVEKLINAPVQDEALQHQAEALLFELGKEALEENGDWVLLHRKRQLELPKG
jgi:hypothetical protein